LRYRGYNSNFFGFVETGQKPVLAYTSSPFLNIKTAVVNAALNGTA